MRQSATASTEKRQLILPAKNDPMFTTWKMTCSPGRDGAERISIIIETVGV